MSGYEGFFFPTSNERKLLEVAEQSMVKAGCCTADEAKAMFDRLNRRPLRRWVILNGLKQEVEVEGFAMQGKIDWEAIANFIVTIAPVIMEIIMAILKIIPNDK